MGNDFAQVIFHISLTTSIIITLILFLIPVLRKRYTSQWRYYVWLIIAVRLLIPINITLPKTAVNISMPEIVMPTSAMLQTKESSLTASPDEKTESALPIDDKASVIPFPQETVESSGQTSVYQETEPTELFSLSKLFVGIWMSGMIVLFLAQAFLYAKFLRKIRFSPRYEVSLNMQEALWRTGKELRIARMPDVRVCSATPSPILAGIFQPTLLLPHDKYSERELLFILRHELVHFRRRDLLYKLLLAVARTVHWFNPIAWMMAAQADRDIELSCDDLVMAGLCDDDRVFYGDTILNALPIKSKWRPEPVFTTSFGSTKKNMKLRLKNLFDHSVKKKGVAAFCVAVLFTGFVSGLVVITPAIASGRESSSAPTVFSNNDSGASRVMLGPYALKKNEVCTVTIMWNEGGAQALQFIKETPTGKESSARTEHRISSRVPLTVAAWEDGNYRFVIPAGNSMTDIVCVVDFEGADVSNDATTDKEYVSFDNVELRAYDDGSPYVHDILTNHTDRTIVAYERGMLAFDKNGSPLKIKWNNSDSEAEPSYYFLYDWGREDIPAGVTSDVYGGWSLFGGNPYNPDPAPEVVWEIEHVLYNFKQVTFDDGTVWINPDYENWLNAYEGEQADLEALKGYYPYEMEIRKEDIRIGSAGLNEVDKAAIELMQYSGNWDVVELLIPNMSTEGIDKLVEMYNEKNQFSNSKKAEDYYNLSGASADDRALTMMQRNGAWKYALALFPFMSNEGIENVVAAFNQKSSGNKAALDFYNGAANALTSENGNAVPPSIESDKAIFQIASSNGKNVASSGSFFANKGQKLSITAESSIKGGTVDLFLFSPSNEEQRFTFGGSDQTIAVEIMAGPWAYNCTGFFESGNIVITGAFENGAIENTARVSDQAVKTGTEAYDNEAIRKMNASGTWGEYINELLPNMSSGAVEVVVAIYLDRHLFPNITTPEGARYVAETIAPALDHMTEDAKESAEKRIENYY